LNRPPIRRYAANVSQLFKDGEILLKIRAVLFDLGYTLWDVDYSGESHAFETLRRRLVKETGAPIPSAAELRAAVSAVFLRETQAWLRAGSGKY
jgi:hypothetical protein